MTQAAIVAGVLLLGYAISFVSDMLGVRYQEARVRRDVHGIGWLARIMEWAGWLPILIAFGSGLVSPWAVAFVCAEGACHGSRRAVRRLIRDEQRVKEQG